MSRRNQMIALGLLFAVLGYRLYVTFRPSENSGTVSNTSGQFAPIDVDNPALRMDILQRFLNLEYKGVHRNIFSATLPPPPPPPQPVKQPPVNGAPAVPTGPPPLTVDAKYFGYVSDAGGSHRRAFFAVNNSEDVFIASEGDTLMGRFRVVKLTNTTADVEEVSSGRRATLILEEPGPNG
jgi:hypothetical protein